MTFLNPLFLLGVLAVSAPIAIHLLSRFRPKPMDFGAMELLRRAMVTRSRQVKLEDWLLLALRCMAIALLAVAMARPTLTGAGAQLAGGGQAAAVIALDGSMSMGHTPGLHSRFDRGVEQVRTILSTLEPGAPLSLVLLGAEPEVLHQGRYDPQQVEAVLEGLEPRPQRLNLDHGLDVLAEQLDQFESGMRELYVVSDMQAEHFAEPSAALRERLAELAETALLLMVPVGDERHENLAVTSLDFAGGALRVGGQARYRAPVRNTGSAARHDVVVQLLRDDSPVDAVTLETIEPGQTATASFLVPIESAGLHRLSVQLERDELTADNAAHAVALVRERVRALVVSGRGGAHWSQDAGGFVARGLQPRGGPDDDEQAPVSVRLVDWMDLAVQNLNDYDLVVLADVPDVAEPQVRSLRRFAARGGAVVIIAGEQTDAALFNARLAGGEAPLSPARLIEPRAASEAEATGSADEDGWPLELASPSHPLARPLAGLPADLMDEARVGRYWHVEPGAGAQVVLALAGAVEAGTAPLLVERVLGRGRVLLLTSAADRRWGTWLIHPAWPILWQQMLAHLTQPAVAPGRVGQPLAVALDPSARIEQVRFAGPREHAVVLSPQSHNGMPVAELPRTLWPGFYTLAAEGGEGEADRDALPAGDALRAVNVDPRESDVRTVEHAALGSAWPEIRGAFVAPERELVEAIRQARVGVELWWPLLLLALAVLVTEAVLARRFTGRMVGGEPATPRRRLHVARWLGTRLTMRNAA